ncbi:hypothetical protein ACFY1P_08330 [Streptomyces sp. NPDC001407]|uniref:hypothetical protein n=1 Tax=Streptomyces sp. NPDC001407 TaxID=3364573 RepID=UPI0036D1B0F5
MIALDNHFDDDYYEVEPMNVVAACGGCGMLVPSGEVMSEELRDGNLVDVCDDCYEDLFENGLIRVAAKV